MNDNYRLQDQGEQHQFLSDNEAIIWIGIIVLVQIVLLLVTLYFFKQTFNYTKVSFFPKILTDRFKSRNNSETDSQSNVSEE